MQKSVASINGEDIVKSAIKLYVNEIFCLDIKSKPYAKYLKNNACKYKTGAQLAIDTFDYTLVNQKADTLFFFFNYDNNFVNYTLSNNRFMFRYTNTYPKSEFEYIFSNDPQNNSYFKFNTSSNYIKNNWNPSLCEALLNTHLHYFQDDFRTDVLMIYFRFILKNNQLISASHIFTTYGLRSIIDNILESEDDIIDFNSRKVITKP